MCHFGNFVEVSLTDIKEFEFLRYCKESKLAPCTVSSLELIGKFNWCHLLPVTYFQSFKFDMIKVILSPVYISFVYPWLNTGDKITLVISNLRLKIYNVHK